MISLRAARSTLLLLTLASVPVACHATPKAPPRRIPTTAPGQSFSALELQPTREEVRSFEVTDGPRKGKILTARIEADGPDQWRYTLEDTRVVFLGLAGDGSLVVTHEQDIGEGVEITYEPALVMLPARLTTGEPFASECEVVVTNLKDGSVRDRGRCRYTSELIGPAPDSPADGEARAWLVRGTRVLDLTLAKADIATETSYVPGGGTVRERVEQETRALGLFAIKKVEELRLRR